MDDRHHHLRDSYAELGGLRLRLRTALEGEPLQETEAEAIIIAYTGVLLAAVQEYQSPMWGDTYLGPLAEAFYADFGSDHTIGPRDRADHVIRCRKELP